jgi:hypothetical protein
MAIKQPRAKTMKNFVLRRGEEIVGSVRSFKEGVDEAGVIAYKERAAEKGLTFEWVGKPPSVATMTRWMDDGIAKSIHGKRVEPDAPDSWIRVLGFI